MFRSSCRRVRTVALLAGPAILAGSVSLTPLVATEAAAASPLSVQPAGSFKWIYDDSGTGAHSDVSFWRPDLSGMPGYHSLGDVAMDSHLTSPANSFVVRDSGDALAPPKDFWKIWDDRGSGGQHDGSIWRPIAPRGYVCLGSVAVNGYDKPSTDLIRCVKYEYTVQGKGTKVWDDSGSGAHGDVAIWQSDARDVNGLSPSTFVPESSYATPTTDFQYRVLNKRLTDVPQLSGAPVTENTARQFAPRVWLAPGERFMPANVEYFLANTHEDNGYLTTNQPLGCDDCADPPFLRGQRPDGQPVSAYAEIIPRTQNGAPTNVTDITYWEWFNYNQGKSVCIGLETPLGCAGPRQRFGNHVGDLAHATIRFVDNLPAAVYYSQHSWGAEYTYGDKRVKLTDWRPDIYAADGSHELYPDAGKHVYYRIPNGSDLVDETGRGILWDTQKTLVAFPWQPQGTYAGKLSWLNITSRWGNRESGCLPNPIGKCVLEDGPEAITSRNYDQPQLGPLE